MKSEKPSKYSEFLDDDIKDIQESIRIGKYIGRTGLGCMDSRNYCINMKLAKNIELILVKAKSEIEAEVSKASFCESRGLYYK